VVRGYLRVRLPLAYDRTVDEAERFLDWVEQARELTPEQHDHIAGQRARYAVDAAARQNRAGHLQFQELRATTPQWGDVTVRKLACKSI
jgi:hypothetical protein